MGLSILQEIVDQSAVIKKELREMLKLAKETYQLSMRKDEVYSRGDDINFDLDEDTHEILMEVIENRDSVMEYGYTVTDHVNCMVSLARRLHKESKDDLPALLDAFISASIEYKENLSGAVRFLKARTLESAIFLMTAINDTDDMEQALQDLKFWYQSQEVE